MQRSLLESCLLNHVALCILLKLVDLKAKTSATLKDYKRYQRSSYYFCSLGNSCLTMLYHKRGTGILDFWVSNKSIHLEFAMAQKLVVRCDTIFHVTWKFLPIHQLTTLAHLSSTNQSKAEDQLCGGWQLIMYSV